MTGLASDAAVGFSLLALIVAPGSIASDAALGSHQLNLALALTGLASDATPGALTVLPQPVWITSDGLVSDAALGVAKVAWAIRPGGIASGNLFGTILISVFLASTRAFRVKAEQRTWTVPVEIRMFTVRR